MAYPRTEEILALRQVYQDYWREPHNRWNTLIDVYHGNFAKLYPGEFKRGEEPKVANWIKLGWDRFATMVAKMPTNHVPPSGVSRVSQTTADKVEKILGSYDTNSGFKKVMKNYGWNLAGLGAGALGVMPDQMLQGPRIFSKDPRVVLPAPGSGSSSVTSSAYGAAGQPSMNLMSLESVIFNEVVTSSYLKKTFPDQYPLLELDDNPTVPNELITFMDDEYWCVIVNQTKLFNVEHGLRFVPVRFTAMDVADQLGGQSMFEQNIGLVLAYTRTLNQKLAYNDLIAWPWLVTKGLAQTNPQERTIEIMDPQGDAQFLSPPLNRQAEQDLQVLDSLIQVMNHDTDSLRGEPPGSIATGRAVVELNRDVKNVVVDFWDHMQPDIEFVKSAALAIDEAMYGSKTKVMSGRVKGENYEGSYIPGKDIKGVRKVIIDFGIGVGGLEGFAELMQVAAQGFVDEQTVMEALPWIDSASETRKKVLLDRIEKIILEMVANGAPAPMINHMGLWRKAIEDGTPAWKWIAENPVPQPELAGPEGGLPAPPGGGQLPPGDLPPGAPPGPQQVPPIPSPQQILAQISQGG